MRRYDHGFTRTWDARGQLGPVQGRVTVHRHRYSPGDLRWVLQPALIVDVRLTPRLLIRRASRSKAHAPDDRGAP